MKQAASDLCPTCGQPILSEAEARRRELTRLRVARCRAKRQSVTVTRYSNGASVTVTHQNRKEGDEPCAKENSALRRDMSESAPCNAAPTSDPEGAARKAKPDVLPTSPEAVAVARLFSRRLTTAWNPKEIKAFRDCRKRAVLTVESMAIIAPYYAAERVKGHEGCHRRDLCTFLNNFDGELDRANAYASRRRPMTRAPEQTTEEYNRRLAESQAQADKLNGSHG